MTNRQEYIENEIAQSKDHTFYARGFAFTKDESDGTIHATRGGRNAFLIQGASWRTGWYISGYSLEQYSEYVSFVRDLCAAVEVAPPEGPSESKEITPDNPHYSPPDYPALDKMATRADRAEAMVVVYEKLLIGRNFTVDA